MFVISEQTVPNYRFEYPFLPSIVIVLQTFGPYLLDNLPSILDFDAGYVCGGNIASKKKYVLVYSFIMRLTRLIYLIYVSYYPMYLS